MPTDSVPIGAEALGRYRIWRTAVQRTTDRIDGLFDSVPVGVALGNFTWLKAKAASAL